MNDISKTILSINHNSIIEILKSYDYRNRVWNNRMISEFFHMMSPPTFRKIEHICHMIGKTKPIPILDFIFTASVNICRKPSGVRIRMVRLVQCNQFHSSGFIVSEFIKCKLNKLSYAPGVFKFYYSTIAEIVLLDHTSVLRYQNNTHFIVTTRLELMQLLIQHGSMLIIRYQYLRLLPYHTTGHDLTGIKKRFFDPLWED